MSDSVSPNGKGAISPELLSEHSPTGIVLQALAKHLHCSFKLVPTIHQLPSGMQWWAKKHGYEDGLRSVYDKATKDVYLLADQITGPYDAAVAFLHEVVSHHGLRSLLHDDFNRTMHSIYEAFEGSPLLDELQRLYNLDVSVPSNRAQLGEELAARMAETGARPDSIQELSLAVREQIYNATNEQIVYEQEDVLVLIQRAKEHLRSLTPSSEHLSKYVPSPANKTLESLLSSGRDEQTDKSFADWAVETARDHGLNAQGLKDHNNMLDLYSDYLRKVHGIRVTERGEITVRDASEAVRQVVGDHRVRVNLLTSSQQPDRMLTEGAPAGAPVVLSDIADPGDDEAYVIAQVRLSELTTLEDGTLATAERVAPLYIESEYSEHRYAAMYIGSEARLRDPERSAFERAVEMAASGAPMNSIREATGWQRSLSGHWEYEISDKSAMTIAEATEKYRGLNDRARALSAQIEQDGVNPDILASLKELQQAGNALSFALSESRPGTVSSYLVHPALFAAYPDIGDMKVVEDGSSLSDSVAAAYIREDNTIVVRPGLSGAAMKKALIHELQHVIQYKEHWAVPAEHQFNHDLTAIESELAALKSRPDYRAAHENWATERDKAFEAYDRREIATDAALDAELKRVDEAFSATPAGSRYNALIGRQQAAVAEIAAYQSDYAELQAQSAADRVEFGAFERRLIAPYADAKAGRDLHFNYAPSAVSYMFVGRNATGFPTEKLSEYNGMAAVGFTNEQLRQDLGIFRGRDGKMRQEIADNLSFVNHSVLREITSAAQGGGLSCEIEAVLIERISGSEYNLQVRPKGANVSHHIGHVNHAFLMERMGPEVASLAAAGKFARFYTLDMPVRYEDRDTVPLGALLEHSALFENYPQLRDWRVRMYPERGLGEGIKGLADASQKVISLTPDSAGEVWGTLLEEVQHAIQVIEGFALGGTPENILASQREDNFAQWFAGSKVTTDDGLPKLLYHYSPAVFGEFRTPAYACDDPAYFSQLDKYDPGKGNVMPGHLKVTNPYKATKDEIMSLGYEPARVEELKAQGYDGAIYTNDTGLADDYNEYVFFYPYQFKSALGNTGEYNIAKNDIAFSMSGGQFYSALERAVADSSPAVATAAEWISQIEAWVAEEVITGNEVMWSGLLPWLEGMAPEDVVERDAVLDEVQDNMVEMVEVHRRDHAAAIMEVAVRPDAWEHIDGNTQVLRDNPNIMVREEDGRFSFIVDDVREEVLGAGATAREAIADGLPLLRNYEGALRSDDVSLRDVRVPGNSQDYHEVLLVSADHAGPAFSGASFDAENVMGFARFDTRINASGERVLFINEIGSEWAELVEEQGSRPSELPPVYVHQSAAGFYTVMAMDEFGEYEPHHDYDTLDDVAEATPRLNKRFKLPEDFQWPVYTHSPDTLPSANPLGSGWPEAVMKRVIRHAVATNHDRIEWPGQAEREAMHGGEDRNAALYNNRLPAAMGKYIDQFGGHLDSGTITTGNRHGFAITSEMRTSIPENGQPMYQMDLRYRDIPSLSTEALVRAKMSDKLSGRALGLDHLAALRNDWDDLSYQSFDIAMQARARLRNSRESVVNRTDMQQWRDLTPVERIALEAVLPVSGSADEMRRALTPTDAENRFASRYFLHHDARDMLHERFTEEIDSSEIRERLNAGRIQREYAFGPVDEPGTVTIEPLASRGIGAMGMVHPFEVRVKGDVFEVELYEDNGRVTNPLFPDDRYMSIPDAVDALRAWCNEVLTGPQSHTLVVEDVQSHKVSGIAHMREWESASGERVLSVELARSDINLPAPQAVDRLFHSELMLATRVAQYAATNGFDRVDYQPRSFNSTRLDQANVIHKARFVPSEIDRSFTLFSDDDPEASRMIGNYPFSALGTGFMSAPGASIAEEYRGQVLTDAVRQGGTIENVMINNGLRNTDAVLADIRFPLIRMGADVLSSRPGQGHQMVVTPDLRERFSKAVAPMAHYAPEGVPASGFYSQLGRVIAAQLPAEGPASVYLDMLEGMARKGKFKRAEYEACGVSEWLADQGTDRIQLSDITDYVARNKIRFRETFYTEMRNDWRPGEATPQIELVSRAAIEPSLGGGGEKLTYHYVVDGMTREDELYSLDGSYIHASSGESFTTLADAETAIRRQAEIERVASKTPVGGGPVYRSMVSPGPIGAYSELVLSVEPSDQQAPGYVTPHWPWMKNVLIHARLSERYASDESKILHVEEIQSDWLQARHNGEPVPDAPFDGNWPTLAMKRVIQYAVRNGYDTVTWSSLQEQMENPDRFEHQKDVSITYAGERNGVPQYVVMNGEGKQLLSSAVDADGLRRQVFGPGTDYFFEEVLPTLNEDAPSATIYDPVFVGGVGLSTLYEQMLPQQMSKYLKRYGCDLENIASLGDGDTVQRVGFRIPPNMREEILADGQPMFRLEAEAPEKSGPILDPEQISIPKGVTVTDMRQALAFLQGEHGNGNRVDVYDLTPAATGLIKAIEASNRPLTEIHRSIAEQLGLGEQNPDNDVLYPLIDEALFERQKIDAYRRSEGEREAAMTRTSRHLTPQERLQRDPLALPEGLTEEDMIISFTNSGPMACFIGESAVTADRTKLARAKMSMSEFRFTLDDHNSLAILNRKPASLRSADESQEILRLSCRQQRSAHREREIFRETGWQLGYDDRWRQWIDDYPVLRATVTSLREKAYKRLEQGHPHVNPEVLSHSFQARLLIYKSYPLEDVYSNRALFEAYPALKIIRIEAISPPAVEASSFDMHSGIMRINEALPPDEQLKAIHHQVIRITQHLDDRALASERRYMPSPEMVELYHALQLAADVARTIPDGLLKAEVVREFREELDLPPLAQRLLEKYNLKGLESRAAELRSQIICPVESTKSLGEHEANELISRISDDYRSPFLLNQSVPGNQEIVVDQAVGVTAFKRRLTAAIGEEAAKHPQLSADNIEAAMAHSTKANGAQAVRTDDRVFAESAALSR